MNRLPIELKAERRHSPQEIAWVSGIFVAVGGGYAWYSHPAWPDMSGMNMAWIVGAYIVYLFYSQKMKPRLALDAFSLTLGAKRYDKDRISSMAPRLETENDLPTFDGLVFFYEENPGAMPIKVRLNLLDRGILERESFRDAVLAWANSTDSAPTEFRPATQGINEPSLISSALPGAKVLWQDKKFRGRTWTYFSRAYGLYAAVLLFVALLFSMSHYDTWEKTKEIPMPIGAAIFLGLSGYLLLRAWRIAQCEIWVAADAITQWDARKGKIMVEVEFARVRKVTNYQFSSAGLNHALIFELDDGGLATISLTPFIENHRIVEAYEAAMQVWTKYLRNQ